MKKLKIFFSTVRVLFVSIRFSFLTQTKMEKRMVTVYLNAMLKTNIFIRFLFMNFCTFHKHLKNSQINTETF